MPSRRDNVQGIKSSGALGNPRSTPPFLGGLGGSQSPEPPFSLVPSTARSLFGGTKRECGVESVGFVNSHAFAGKGRGNIRPKYVKRVPALRPNLFCRNLRRGTFHRRKVPTGRRGLRPLRRSSDVYLVTSLTATTIKIKRTVPDLGTVLPLFGLTE